MKRIAWVMIAVVLLGMGGGLASCAERSKSVQVEEKTVMPGTTAAAGETVVERRVERSEVRETDSDGGVISGVFDIVGDILSLPFRLVAGLFQIIF
jgi:hypothetical protein